MIAHYTALAEASSVPIILYNVPSRTGVDMLAETTAELSKHPNIIGIKEANGELQRIKDLVSLCDKDFLVISGDDALTPKAVEAGAVGAISVLGNAFPVDFGACIHKALKGLFFESQQEFETMQEIDKLLYKEGNPVGIKGLLELMNLTERTVRLPLVSASEDLMQELLTALLAFPR
jgi:4-hydroxy-tetrahydrodipicolinate synthase